MSQHDVNIKEMKFGIIYENEKKLLRIMWESFCLVNVHSENYSDMFSKALRSVISIWDQCRSQFGGLGQQFIAEWLFTNIACIP